MYKIDGIWYTLTPIPVKAEDPFVIDSLTNTVREFKSSQSLVIHPKNFKLLQERIIFANNRSSILSNFAKFVLDNELLLLLLIIFLILFVV